MDVTLSGYYSYVKPTSFRDKVGSSRAEQAPVDGVLVHAPEERKKKPADDPLRVTNSPILLLYSLIGQLILIIGMSFTSSAPSFHLSAIYRQRLYPGSGGETKVTCWALSHPAYYLEMMQPQDKSPNKPRYQCLNRSTLSSLNLSTRPHRQRNKYHSIRIIALLPSPSSSPASRHHPIKQLPQTTIPHHECHAA